MKEWEERGKESDCKWVVISATLWWIKLELEWALELESGTDSL